MRRKGRESKLGDRGHVRMQNRHGLVVDARLAQADDAARAGFVTVLRDPTEERAGCEGGGARKQRRPGAALRILSEGTRGAGA